MAIGKITAEHTTKQLSFSRLKEASSVVIAYILKKNMFSWTSKLQF